jgi:uncharacterized protein (DUF58 family)
MRVTRRGHAVLGAAVALLAAGWWARYPLLGVLGAILLGAVLAAALLTAGTVRVSVQRTVHPVRVTRDRPAVARLRIRNDGTRRQAAFTATDTAGPAARTVRVPGLLPGAEAVLHYELPTGTRGKWTVGPLTLDRADAFGLARSSSVAGEPATLWVHPRRFPARVPSGAQRRHHHEGTVADATLRGSIELTDVREYVPGDEVRLLHWKATARAGRLMVRDLADPHRSRFTVLLDIRRGPELFEDLIEVAASLVTASVAAGQQTCLATSAGRTSTADGGPGAAHRLLDMLSEIGQEDTVALPECRGGSLVVLTVAGGPEVVPAAWARQRFGRVFVIGLGGPVEMPGARVLWAPTAEAAVRRWNEAAG